MLVYKVAHCVAAQAGFSMHAACVVSVAWFVPAVPSVMASQPTALKITSMYVCALQAFNISCQKQPTAPADCNLLLYYNSTGMFEDGTTNMSGLIKPPFGIPAGQLPDPVAPYYTADFNATEVPLNRTEPVYNATLRPMLFFFGGPTCHVVLNNPKIAGCQLKESVGADQAVVSVGLMPLPALSWTDAAACMHTKMGLQRLLVCQMEQLQALPARCRLLACNSPVDLQEEQEVHTKCRLQARSAAAAVEPKQSPA